MNDSLGVGEVLLTQCVPGVPTPLTIALSTQGAIEVVVTYSSTGESAPAMCPSTRDSHEQVEVVGKLKTAQDKVELDDIDAWPKSDC